MRLAAASLLMALFLLMNSSEAQINATKRSEYKIGQHAPDVIFLNGDIYVGIPLTGSYAAAFQGEGPGAKSPPRAQAMAVELASGRIVAVGTNADIQKLTDKHTQIIDLGGRFVMPGFNDAHLHLAGGGFEKLNVNLVGVKSLDEMKSRIADRAKTTPAGEWLQGRGWDHTIWPGQKLPTRQDLDAVTGGHPAVFVRVDGHIAVANSEALKFWGITRSTPDPAGGQIDRDPQGEPTGILRESAKDQNITKLPKPTPSQRRRAIELALQDAASHGVTSVQDNSDWEDFLTCEDIEREGNLTLRISEWLPFDAPVPTLDQHRAAHPHHDPMLHTGMLKGFMDGSLGSRTAAMLKPYSDDPGNSGLPQYDQARLNQMAEERVAARFQMGFHAIGDRAVQMALDAFEAAERYAREKDLAGLGPDPQQRDFRFRVEHAQVLAPDQFARFRQLHVIASMQPNHLLTDMNWAMDRIGSDRAKFAYAWKTFLDHGVRLAFGTDYPVEPITPFRGLYAAVTRKNEAGTKEFDPEQRITIEQAIEAYTTGAAYAEFEEKDKGTLAPGMLADFVVLDRDITKVPPPELLRTNVLRTVVGGKTVYEVRSQGNASRS
ncbi:MAG TPA: amidohydrolase [Terriglobales bacterium]|nr:amidohydrolase [Terriglobales bacterium]